MKIKLIILILIISCFRVGCIAQSDSNSIFLIESYPIYGIDFPLGKVPLLSLTDSLDDFNYKGKIYCTVIIDQEEKYITEVFFYSLELNNEIDTINIQFSEKEYLTEYSGNYKELLIKIYPFLVSFLKTYSITESPMGSVFWKSRYSSWVIPIEVQ